MKNKLVIYSAILGFLGFFLSTYLTILDFKHIIPPCSVTGGCETVLTSSFSKIGPVPLALLGSLFYLGVIILSVLILTSYKKLFANLLCLFAITGFIVSVVLIYIQAAILHAFCQYCLTSEAISTGILILAFLDYRNRKSIDNKNTQE